ncbi:MAG: hypothetical protein JWN63_890 [Candidatus Acidoferrum typicum]|nr:hypothetical protein [Candidatus Acidoferrum typicum]
MRSPAIYRGLLRPLVALFLLLTALTRAQAVPQEQDREPLGSLTSIGEVYVNESPATVEITIFSGDRVRTGESGSATFNMSGKGSLKLSPRSQVLFSGKYEYTAELEAGAVVMNSVSGPNGFTLRIGNDVLVPPIKERTALASIDRAPDGSFLVACSDGAIGVLTLKGTSGLFLQVGQSVSAAPNGQLFPVVQQAATTERLLSGRSSSGARRARGSYTGWGLLGAAAAGAAGIAAAQSHGGGKQPVSPSAP